MHVEYLHGEVQEVAKSFQRERPLQAWKQGVDTSECVVHWWRLWFEWCCPGPGQRVGAWGPEELWEKESDGNKVETGRKGATAAAREAKSEKESVTKHQIRQRNQERVPLELVVQSQPGGLSELLQSHSGEEADDRLRKQDLHRVLSGSRKAQLLGLLLFHPPRLPSSEKTKRVSRTDHQSQCSAH